MMAGTQVVSPGLARDPDAVWTIGRRLRRERHARRKSLQVIAGLAGMNKNTLWRIERGERALDRLSEIVALARALQISPVALLEPLWIDLVGEEAGRIRRAPVRK